MAEAQESEPRESMAPPSYNELFGQEDQTQVENDEVRNDTPPQLPPPSEDSISIPIDITESRTTAPPPHDFYEPPRWPSGCPTLSNCLRSSPGCCDLNESRRRTLFIVTYVVGVCFCIGNTTVGKIVRSCSNYLTLADFLLLIGVLGFIYLAFVMFRICRWYRGHDEGKILKVLRKIVGPCIILATFYFGAALFYAQWELISCVPFAHSSCICRNTLVMYSMMFYSIGMVVAVPSSLFILYVMINALCNFLERKICL